jgi:hypothetical protein
VKVLEQQNATLTQQSWEHKRRAEVDEGSRDGGRHREGDGKHREGDTSLLRAKLKEANQQIVNLLMEKVNLKQQINQLQRR